uniref:(California timema) hypothetical protein n=1 Tax=Timema californicum TaxID=61474 RepID=A0A7R9J5W9_TIMCA|nr:unnamed protein product [Timema californicum]
MYTYLIRLSVKHPGCIAYDDRSLVTKHTTKEDKRSTYMNKTLELGRFYVYELYPNLRGELVENNLGETTLTTPDRDLNLDLSVIGGLVYCESNALDRAVIEAEDKVTARLGVVRSKSFLYGDEVITAEPHDLRPRFVTLALTVGTDGPELDGVCGAIIADLDVPALVGLCGEIENFKLAPKHQTFTMLQYYKQNARCLQHNGGVSERFLVAGSPRTKTVDTPRASRCTVWEPLGGDVLQETITANVSEDCMTLEFQRSDGTLVTQLLDFRNVIYLI